MIHLSSYHSNGLPTVVWPNKVNLIGEKVYKPKIHFCEHCNKPILIYGRLIPCKHVFCFTCATICLTQTQQSMKSANSPPPVPSEPPPPPYSSSNHHNHNQGSNHLSANHRSPSTNHASPHFNYTSNNNGNNSINHKHGNNSPHYHSKHPRSETYNNNLTNNNNSSQNLDFLRSDSNQSFPNKDNNGSCSMIIDESTSNTTPTTLQQEIVNSPNVSSGGSGSSKGCHRCGGKALRVERNTLNSIFVCQIETCRRTYLSARDLQAHVTHRHSKNKSSNPGTFSASLVAISSSPYISSSSLMHLNNNQVDQHNIGNQPQSSASAHNQHPNHNSSRLSNNSPSYHPSNNHHHHHSHNHQNNHSHHSARDQGSSSHHHARHQNQSAGATSLTHRDRDKDNRDRCRDRDTFQRDRERERENRKYHRQSIQRAAQWAEASAQIMEKGLTR